MSQFREMEVWTEREGDNPATPNVNEGDWEACVATAYEMGLLFGGVTMAAPYTQAEREKLEAVYDTSQDLSISDGMARAVYGHALRGPTVTSSKAAFLARPGLGFCLTGVGSPVGAQAGTFMHEVFGYARSTTVVRVYDPLRPAGSQPTDMTVAAMAAWMKGVGPNDVREVARDEFGVTDTTTTTYPAPRTWLTKGGALSGYRLSPAPTSTSGVFNAGSPAHSDAEVQITPTPAGWPAGPYQRVIDGKFAGFLVANSAVSLQPVPLPPTTDCTKAVADAVKPLNEEIARLKGLIAQHNQVESDLHDVH